MANNDIYKKMKSMSLSSKNVEYSTHFKEKFMERLSMRIDQNNKVELMNNIIKKSNKNDMLLQLYKGRKRIIFVWRGATVLMAFDEFIEQGKIVLITILKKGMSLLGKIKKFEVTSKYSRKNKENKYGVKNTYETGGQND